MNAIAITIARRDQVLDTSDFTKQSNGCSATASVYSVEGTARY